MVAFAWAIVLLLVFALPTLHRTSDTPLPVTLFPAFMGLGRLTLETVRARVEVSDDAVAVRSLHRWRGRTLPAEDILRYAIHEGEWYVVVKGRTAHVPIAPPGDVHAAMAEILPKKLAAKRLRMKTLPPSEDFTDLLVFDPRRPPMPATLFAALLLGLVVLFRTGIGAFGALLLLVALLAIELSVRLDVTTEGLVRRGLLGTRRIAWAEATAIFCERPKKGRRSFLVTALGRSIAIPAHLARDLETMRKVLCSLPEDTRCVNFDATTFRGYRRRKKAQEHARQGDLLPVLTH